MKPPDDAEQGVRSHWNRDANSWSQAVSEGKDVINDEFGLPCFAGFVGDVNGLDVLDLGCGEGRSSRMLAERGANVVGLDISEKMIEAAQKHSRTAVTRLHFEVGSASNMHNMNDASFDAVVSYMALMDMPNLKQVFSEAHRVTRPGGRFAFMIRHPCFFTPGTRIVSLGGQSRDSLLVADYLSKTPFVERWGFTGTRGTERFSTPRFPRTLDQYVDALQAPGFSIERILEPRPGSALCRRYPFLEFWNRHAALYLFMSGIKPT
jgi:SAM-dependent methyltransferase